MFIVEMTKEQLKDRPLNFISVLLHTESRCNVSEGEYSMCISSFIGSLDISAIGGVDDVTLVKDCINNHLDFGKLPKEWATEIVLKESGEWEDVFWHKYYEIYREELVQVAAVAVAMVECLDRGKWNANR